jgi:Holliday junction resolvase RusA-like endonuclease
MVLSDEARQYKQVVALAYRRAELKGDIAVDLTWYRQRRSGDLDKRLGVILDSLQGIAYATDAQITQLTARRIDDPKNARVVVTVSPAAP